jgi:hypothetical protein
VIKNEAGHLNILFANEGIFEFGTLGAITEMSMSNEYSLPFNKRYQYSPTVDQSSSMPLSFPTKEFRTTAFTVLQKQLFVLLPVVEQWI